MIQARVQYSIQYLGYSTISSGVVPLYMVFIHLLIKFNGEKIYSLAVEVSRTVAFFEFVIVLYLSLYANYFIPNLLQSILDRTYRLLALALLYLRMYNQEKNLITHFFFWKGVTRLDNGIRN